LEHHSFLNYGSLTVSDVNGDDGQGGDLNNKSILLTKTGYSLMATDMDGDNLPELCVGAQIYSSTADSSANAFW
jgi:hypothetical protein